MERETSTPSANTEEVTTGSQTETILPGPLAEVTVHESGEWNVLEKSDMVGSANGEENMEAMWEDGWNFGKCRYPGLATDAGGPTDEIISCADSPLKLFFSFMSKSLCRTIAEEANRYLLQNLTARVDRIFDSQRTPGKQTKEWFLHREAKNQKTRYSTS
ncbi:hypothetical protein PHMEG_00032273 [Phytophthora megakarya]|uniref:Uncharacterized protein n=1 Tax=Phytophthora megakarya TaxID=4795 RepID=A0A225UVW6_9STRA|nr:hypothetical protein PHMEG_00032273 [Phytophthora megakarya]